jgi:hypothetical protein
MYKKLLRLFLFVIFSMTCSYTAIAQTETDVTDMVILLDRSGSMNWASGDKRGLSRAAVEFLLDQLELANPENRAALILFESTVNIIPANGLTNNLDEIRSRLSEVKKIKGDTDLEMALTEGLRLLAKNTARREMVLISDGQPDPDPYSANSRIVERFPDLYERFHKAKDANKKSLQKKIRTEMQVASAKNIEKAQFGALREAGIEIYPIGLSGIQELGEELLRKMAVEITKDAAAFKKVKGNDMGSALDQIVPKPESLINIKRDEFNGGGHNKWSTNFHLGCNLDQVRVLLLYENTPPDDIEWQIQGPSGVINNKQVGDARYMVAKDKNGEGRRIFERIFLDRPLKGDYSFTVKSGSFLEPMCVIVEGRTKARIIVKAEPDPAEVGLPVDVFCRIEGSSDISLSNAKASIINELGQEVAQIEHFTLGPDEILNAAWTPSDN